MQKKNIRWFSFSLLFSKETYVFEVLTYFGSILGNGAIDVSLDFDLNFLKT